MSRPPLDPIQFPIKWIPRLLFTLIKRPEHEADYPSPSSAEIKNERSYSFPLPVCLPGSAGMSWATVYSTIRCRNGKQCIQLQFIWQLAKKVQEWALFVVCHAGSRRYLTAEARVQFLSSPRKIYGGQIDTGTGICPSAGVFPPALFRQYAIVIYPSPTWQRL